MLLTYVIVVIAVHHRGLDRVRGLKGLLRHTTAECGVEHHRAHRAVGGIHQEIVVSRPYVVEGSAAHLHQLHTSGIVGSRHMVHVEGEQTGMQGVGIELSCGMVIVHRPHCLRSIG